MKKIFLLGVVFLVTACSVDSVYDNKPLDDRVDWVLLPIINQSQTPQAGERVESILLVLLRQKGIRKIGHYPKTVKQQSLMLLDNQARYRSALKWALRQGYRYGITGTVEEWRYKAGLDGEPAVGITLRVIDLAKLARQQKKVIPASTEKLTKTPDIDPVAWSATGARTGWGREGLATATHKLLNKLLNGMTLTSSEP